MIKLFSKIRKNLLAEGKTSKYVKYAVGEIALVVLGILIAIQINNWNEEQKNNREQLFYLKNLKENLKQDTLSLNEQIAFLNIKSNHLKRMSRQGHSISGDSLELMLVNGLLSTSGFNAESTTWNNLQSTGNVDKIKRKELVDSLFIYYNFYDSKLQVWMESDQAYSRQNIAPFLMRNFNLNYDIPPKEKLIFEPIDQNINSLEIIKDHLFFRNALRYKNNASSVFFNLFETQKKRATSILQLIDEELE